MSAPAVSIVIPTFNRAILLPRAIRSVARQTFNDWEIVLIDDGSMDDTARIARQYANELKGRFVYHRQENRGAGQARNTGIDLCRGRYVAFLDSDDEFAPTKLARQLELLARRPELGFVYSDYSFVDLDGVGHGSAFVEKLPLARGVRSEVIGPRLHVCDGSLFDTLLRGYFIATIVGMVRREALGDSVRFPVEHRYAEEWLFYLRLARHWPAGFVDEPLSIHHFVKGSEARRNPQANLVQLRALVQTIETEFALTASQRAVVRKQRAHTARQLAYDAARRSDFARAFAYQAEALRLRPSWHGLPQLLRWGAGAMWPGHGGVGAHPEAAAQPSVPAVR